MSGNFEKKKLVTGKTFAKILGIVSGSFFGIIAITIGIMYFLGAFNEPKILPSNIQFRILEKDLIEDSVGTSYYSPEILNIDNDGEISIADYFYLNIDPLNENVTEKEITLSVSNNDVIRLESNTATLGEPIKIIICKDRYGIPYGGYSEITARSNSGINGVSKLNVFIDVPVKSLNIKVEKTSMNNSSLFVNEEMTLNMPTFLPEKSLNPSKVSEGKSSIVKSDKQYIYKVEYKVNTQNGEEWIDLDGTNPLNIQQNKVIVWNNTTKTKLKAVKTGEFRLTAYAFDTYSEQEKFVESETEAEKIARMRAVSEVKYYTITEVDYQSISSTTFSSSNSISLEYKKSDIKIYLRTNKTSAQLESENAVNLNLQINPNPNYGISAKDLYDKIQNIYITTNLTDQNNQIRIKGREETTEGGDTFIYPYFDDSGEYQESSLKEYYYLVDATNKISSDFYLYFNIVNPNNNAILTFNAKAKITEVGTDIFGFERPSDMTDTGVYDKLSISSNSGVASMNVTIDASKTNYVDLSKFVINKSSTGKKPTYDKIVYYLYMGDSVTNASNNRGIIASYVDLTSMTGEYKEILTKVFCLEIKDGIFKPLSYGNVVVYAVLVQTDINGNDMNYSVTGTTTYQTAQLDVSINVKLGSVELTVLDSEFNDLEETELKENYDYNVKIIPLVGGNEASENLITNNINNIKFVISNNQVIVDGIITFNEQTGYYYLPIKVVKLSGQAQPVQITCFLTENNQDVYLGETIVFDIKPTAVKSLRIKNDDYYEFKASWNSGTNKAVWEDKSTGLVLNNPEKFEIEVEIDGENQGFELTSSDITSISTFESNGKKYIKLIKPSSDIITITATSVENSNIFDAITFKLLSENVVFGINESFSSSGILIVDPTTGDVMKNGQVYSEQVYKGDEINLLDRITVTCGNDTGCTGMLSYEFETNVDFATFSSDNNATVVITKNVKESQNITVVIKTIFGNIMRYRLVVSNYISVEFIENLPYNDYYNDISGETFQNRAIISKYNDQDYITFVWNPNDGNKNELNFKGLLNIQSKKLDVVPNLEFAVSRTNVNGVNPASFISITNGIIKSRSTSQKLLEPILTSIEVREPDIQVDGEINYIFSKKFPILIVPNLLTKKEVKDNKTIYLAGNYIFTKDLEDSYSFDENSIANFTKDLDEVFVVQDFSGKKIEGATATYNITNAGNFASLDDSNKSMLIVERDKVFSDTAINIDISFLWNGATITTNENININAFYKIRTNIDDNGAYSSLLTGDEGKIYLQLYTGQDNVKMVDIITVNHDESNLIKESITYRVSSGNSFVRIMDQNSKNARLVALAYSDGAYAKIAFDINGKDTGFAIYVKVVHDLDNDYYHIANEYKNTFKTIDENNNDSPIALYDSTGKQIINVYNDKHELISLYDKNGDVVSKVYDINGNTINVYDAEKNLIVTNIYNFDKTVIDISQLNGKSINVYDKNGNMIDIYDVNGEIVKTFNRVNSNTVIPLRNIFIAKKLSNIQNDVALTYLISDTTVAYIDNLNRLCFYPCAVTKRVSIVAYPANLQGVEKLECKFEVNPSQNLSISYKYAENDITTINQSIYSLDEEAEGFRGYIELKAGDKVYIKDYIKAVNIIDNIEEDIFSLLSFTIEQYDFTNNIWVKSTLYSINDLNKPNPYIQPLNNFSELMYTRIKVTTTGGLLGYFNVILATNTTVNDDTNVIITMNYPKTSSNYYGDNLQYECVMPGVGDIDLTSYDNNAGNIRRIYAEFNRVDVTRTLVFRYEAYDIINNVVYNGTGISISGSVITINNDVRTGIAIKVYMHNTYQEFVNTYNFYVGGNTSIVFANGLQGEGQNAYNSIVVYSTVNQNSNIIDLVELFTITDLSGERISLLSDKVKISLSMSGNNVYAPEDLTTGIVDKVGNIVNNQNYIIATLINRNNTKAIVIDNYAFASGQIIEININVKDEFDKPTNAVYRLKVLPSVVNFTNGSNVSNSEQNPFNVHSEQNEITPYKFVIYDSEINLIDFNSLIANSSNETYSLSDISVETNDTDLLTITENSGEIYFTVNKTVDVPTLVEINITTKWGRTEVFYVNVLPSNRLTVVGSGTLNIYSLTDLELFNSTKTDYVKIEKINTSTNSYIVDNYNPENIIVEAYWINGNNQEQSVLDNSDPTALVHINNNGVLSFASVSENTSIRVDVYFKDKKETSIVSLNVVVSPNFTPADITITINNIDNSINNPVLLNNNEFCLSDLVTINRFASGSVSVSSIRYSLNDITTILKTFTYSSDNLDVYLDSNDWKLKAKVKDSFTSSVDEVSPIELKLFNGAIFKTFYVLIKANYSFSPVNDFSVAYAGLPLDLSYVTDYFVKSDGEKLVGGELSFKAIDDLENLVTIDNNKIMVNNDLQEEKYITILALYSLEDGRQFIGSLDLALQPSITVKAKSDAVTFVDSIEIVNVINENNGKQEQRVKIDNVVCDDFAKLYFDLYKCGNKVGFDIDTISYVFVLSDDVNFTDNKEAYKVTIKIQDSNEVVVSQDSVYFIKNSNQNEYYYSKYENTNVYIGGDSITLLSVVGEFYEKGNNNEYTLVEPYSIYAYDFLLVNSTMNLGGDLSQYIDEDNGVLYTKFSVSREIYTILMRMYGANGKYYIATIDIEVKPSVLMSMVYTHPQQGLTILNANTEINIKDYMYFSPQRASARSNIQSNTTTKYECFIYDESGNLVTNNTGDICEITGYTPNTIYANLQPKLKLKVGADGYLIVLKASMKFYNNGDVNNGEYLGEVYDYYFIKVVGMDYSFNQTNIPSLGLNDTLTLDMFGQFSVGISSSDITFIAVGDYYKIENNTIVEVNNLYNQRVEVLISVKSSSDTFARQLYAVAKFDLNTKYVIENKTLADVNVLRFDVLSDNKGVDILSSNYINVNAYDKLKTIRIDLYSSNGVQVLTTTNRYLDLIEQTSVNNKLSNSFFSIYAGENAINENYNKIYLINVASNDSVVDLTGFYAVIQLEFNSVNQYKYVQFTLDFVKKLKQATIKYNGSSTIDVDPNNDNGGIDLDDLSITILSGEEEIQVQSNMSGYLIKYFVPDDDYIYVKVVGGKPYLKANPYFTNKLSKLLVVVYYNNGFVGQGNIDVRIKAVNFANNETKVIVDSQGYINNTSNKIIDFSPILKIQTGENVSANYVGSYSNGTLSSNLYNMAGVNITGSYSDYLEYTNNTFQRNTNVLSEDCIVYAVKEISLKNEENITTDKKLFYFLIKLEKTKWNIYLTSDNVNNGEPYNMGTLDGEHRVNVSALNQRIEFSIKNDFNQNATDVELQVLNSGFGSTIEIDGNALIAKALYENTIATIAIKSEPYKLRSIIQVVFGDYTQFATEKDNIEVVNLNDEISISQNDTIIALNEVTNEIINNVNDIIGANKIIDTNHKVLKAKYIICVKSGTGIYIDGQEILTIKLYKTVEIPYLYDIKLNSEASSVIEFFTTDDQINYNLSLVVNGVVKSNVNYSFHNLNKIVNSAYDVEIDENKLVVKPKKNYNQADLVTTYKFILDAVSDGVTYSKEFIINCRRPFVNNMNYSYEFDLTTAFENGYEWQKVLSLSDFNFALNDNDLDKITFNTPFANTNLHFEAMSYGGDIYARVPNLNVEYNNGNVVYSSNGYEEVLALEIVYNYGSLSTDTYRIGRMNISIKILPLNQAYNMSMPYTKVISYDFEEDLPLTISNAVVGGNTANIIVNGEIIDTVTASNSISVVSMLDETNFDMLKNYYTFAGNKYTLKNIDAISDKLNLTFKLAVKLTIDGNDITNYYFLRIINTYELKSILSFYDIDYPELFIGETITRSPRIVLLDTSIQNVTNFTTDMFKQLPEIVTDYNSLTNYNLEFIKVDNGYEISNNGALVKLNVFANTGISFVQVKATSSSDTIIFYLPILKNGTKENELRFIVKDDNNLYASLKDFDNNNKSAEMISIISGLVEFNDIDVTKLNNLGNSLIFSVKLNNSDASITNLVATYVILEVRCNEFKYYKNLSISSTTELVNQNFSSFTDSDDETIVSVEIVNGYNGLVLKNNSTNVNIQNYANINLPSSNISLCVPPVFRNKVVNLIVTTNKNGIYRYYNVELTVKAVAKYEVSREFNSVPNSVIKGVSSLELPVPNFDLETGITATWSLYKFNGNVFDNNIVLNGNILTINQADNVKLNSFLVYLTVSSNYGQYIYEYYISVVDTQIEVEYTQNEFTVISGSTFDFSKAGVWTIKENGVEINEQSGYEISYVYRVPNDNAYTSNNEYLNTKVSVLDKLVVAECEITITKTANAENGLLVNKVYSFTKNIYLTIQSGIQFLSGSNDVTQTRNIHLITNASGISVSDLKLLQYQMNTPSIMYTGIELREIEDYMSILVNLEASEGSKKFEYEVTDTIGNTKVISFEINVITLTKQFFEYNAPITAVTINSNSSKIFTKSVNDIGTFKLLETTIGTDTLPEKVLNNDSNYDFAIYYTGNLLRIDNKTIYAKEVLNPTTVTIQVVLYDIASEYVGYMTIEILPIYTFNMRDENRVYNIISNSTISIYDIIEIKKSNTIIDDIISEDFDVNFEFENNNIPENYKETGTLYNGTSITVSYKDAGKMFKIKVHFIKNGEVRTIDYIIDVEDLIYSLESKNDVYNVYSKQTIDLSKLDFKFYDNEGCLIPIPINNIRFINTDVNGSYTLEGTKLTACKTFNPIVTSFGVEGVVTDGIYSGTYRGNVQLIINATYTLNIEDSITLYAGRPTALQFNVWDIYRNQNAIDEFDFVLNVANTEFIYEEKNGVKALNAELSHSYSNQKLEGVFIVKSGNVKYIERNISINVRQSRFLSLVATDIYFDNEITSSAGKNLINTNIIKLVDEKGNRIELVASDFSIKCIDGSGDDEILTNNNYKYTTNTTEQITIRITDLKTGQFVDYVCLVRS